jgi:hypothetical protein
MVAPTVGIHPLTDMRTTAGGGGAAAASCTSEEVCMKGKVTFMAGFGAGYVLGARSGRERYDQIMKKLEELWRDPRVQQKTHQAERVAQDKAQQAGQTLKEKAGSVAASVRSSTTSSSAGNGADMTAGVRMAGESVDAGGGRSGGA